MATKRKQPPSNTQNLNVLDKEDRHMQKVANQCKNPQSWIRGWNKVKYKLSSQH